MIWTGFVHQPEPQHGIDGPYTCVHVTHPLSGVIWPFVRLLAQLIDEYNKTVTRCRLPKCEVAAILVTEKRWPRSRLCNVVLHLFFLLQATLEKLDLEVEPWSPSAWTPNLLCCMWFGNPEYSRSKGSYLLAGLCLSENRVKWLEVTARGNITSGFWQPCADTRYPQPNHWSLSCGIRKIPSKCTNACVKSRRKNTKCSLQSQISDINSLTSAHEIDVQFKQSDLKISATCITARSPAWWHEALAERTLSPGDITHSCHTPPPPLINSQNPSLSGDSTTLSC